MLYMFCLCKHIILLVANEMLFSSPEQARQMSQKSGKIIEIKVMAETQFYIDQAVGILLSPERILQVRQISARWIPYILTDDENGTNR